MKKIFLLAFAAVGLLFAACSEDEDGFNTGAAIVLVKQPTGEKPDSVRENKTLYVPIKVEGEQNGAIEVTVEVSSNREDYVEDKDYIVTSHHVRIPAHKDSVNVEVRLVDEKIINPDAEDLERVLTVKIVSVQGAKIDALRGSANFRIIDNDNSVYERMAGEWNVYAVNGFTGSAAPQAAWTVEWETYDYEEELYETEYKLSPWPDGDGNLLDVATYGKLPLRFKSVMVDGKEKVTVSFRCGAVVATGLDYDDSADHSNEDKQNCSIRLISYGMGPVTTGNITGTVNETYDRVVFDMPVIGEVVTKSNQSLYTLYYWYNIVMTKK